MHSLKEECAVRIFSRCDAEKERAVDVLQASIARRWAAVSRRVPKRALLAEAGEDTVMGKNEDRGSGQIPVGDTQSTDETGRGRREERPCL